jgi:NAD(P)-dependent dehydrogenase (short-subunit alcohol dehydrogenase family)
MLEAITGEQLEQQFKVNVFGTAAMIRHVLRYRVNGGLMVAIHALLPDRVWRALLGAGMNRAPKPPHGATATGTA